MPKSTAPDFTVPSLDFSPIIAVDRTYGFLGTRLGTPLSQLPDMRLLAQGEEGSIYTRPSDSLQVGGANVSSIEYLFDNDQILAHIFIHFASEDIGVKLRDAFSRVYGRGAGTDKLVYWKGLEADIIYTVKGKGGYLSISK